MFKAAYGAGWRAGMAKPRVQRPGGTRGIKVIIQPENPYPKWWQFLLRHVWNIGYYEGQMESFRRWRRVI